MKTINIFTTNCIYYKFNCTHMSEDSKFFYFHNQKYFKVYEDSFFAIAKDVVETLKVDNEKDPMNEITRTPKEIKKKGN